MAHPGNDGESEAVTPESIVRMVLSWQERQSSAAAAMAQRELRWRNIRAVLVVIGICLAPFGSVAALRMSVDAFPSGPYVALVRINGLIQAGSPAGSDPVNTSLARAFADHGAKGVIVAIDSPGGTPVQASLINEQLRSLRASHPDTRVWAVGQDMLTSGAYLVAVGADHICVNRSTLTGSIGVRLDGWGFQNVLKRLGVERRSFTAGVHKERLDAYRELSKDDRVKIERLLAELHQQFIDAVKRGRGERLRSNPDELYSGDFWSGDEAVQLGLVDGLCSLESLMHDAYGVSHFRDYSPSEPLLSKLSGGLMRRASETMGATLTESVGSWRAMLLP